MQNHKNINEKNENQLLNKENMKEPPWTCQLKVATGKHSSQRKEGQKRTRAMKGEGKSQMYY